MSEVVLNNINEEKVAKGEVSNHAKAHAEEQVRS